MHNHHFISLQNRKIATFVLYRVELNAQNSCQTGKKQFTEVLGIFFQLNLT